MSRNTAKAQALADQIGNGATAGTFGATPLGDIVIVAVPYANAARPLKVTAARNAHHHWPCQVIDRVGADAQQAILEIAPPAGLPGTGRWFAKARHGTPAADGTSPVLLSFGRARHLRSVQSHRGPP